MFVTALPYAVMLDNCAKDPFSYWHFELPKTVDTEGDDILPVKVIIPSPLLEYYPQ